MNSNNKEITNKKMKYKEFKKHNKCYSCKETKELTKVQGVSRKGWIWLCKLCNFIEKELPKRIEKRFWEEMIKTDVKCIRKIIKNE